MGDPPPATLTAISTTPVKGLALHPRESVALGPLGAEDNRAFYLVDARSNLVNGKRVGALSAVRADLSDPRPSGGEPGDERSPAVGSAPHLSLTFPDGTALDEAVTPAGPPTVTRFFSRTPTATPVCPTLSAALSEFAGMALTLVRADPALTASDRGPQGVVSLLSRGSLAHLGAIAGEEVDPRRFRMLLEVDGLDAHAEDAYVGHAVRIGAAVVRFLGHVGRCRVTSMDPDTGEVTLPTLDLLGYRRGLATTEPLAFGIYGEVLEPGQVRVGDRVSLERADRHGASAVIA